MTYINIKDNKCYRCGKTDLQLTSHHTLPQHLKPKHNVLIPVCSNCHKDITADDITGMYSYVYKLEKHIMSLLKQVSGIKTAVENNFKIQIRGKKDGRNKTRDKK